ncbi:MAG: L-seryl-tRNA(Sec) selenium transferase [Anaerolineae bacterium]
MEDQLRRLPSVDRLLRLPDMTAAEAQWGHDLVLKAARRALDAARRAIIEDGAPCPPLETLGEQALAELDQLTTASLRRVINATGVIIHTNLGRAPLSEAARQAMIEAATGYTNLEYDLEQGVRGSRYDHAVRLLCELTGAEDALVVNNNAAAVLLSLATVAAGREVIVSRGQLVEIGGGFRVPDVMRQSGARLVEVGTTNRTHRRDYEAAIGPETAALLRVHPSNFRVVGFTAEVALEELVEIAQEHGLAVLDDLGSGSLLDTTVYGLAPEPRVQDSVAAGADLVTFSGDKLLGGPQAGVIVGRAKWIRQLRRHSLARAVRVDKLTLAALQATLLHYLRGEAEREIPVWRMIAASEEQLRARAEAWRGALAADDIDAEVVPTESTVGGGSLPGETLPGWALALTFPSADDLACQLRLGDPPVVARIVEDRVLLDPRTVLPEEDEAVVMAVKRAWRRSHG